MQRTQTNELHSSTHALLSWKNASKEYGIEISTQKLSQSQNSEEKEIRWTDGQNQGKSGKSNYWEEGRMK